MNFFFDNNLPPLLAHAIAALSKVETDVSQVIHLQDRFSRNEKDIVWIAGLSETGEPWSVISIDKFRKDHRAERVAIHRARHTVYVLDAQWSSQTFWAKAGRLVVWWPTILAHARLVSGGVYRVPWRHTSQTRLQAM